MDKHVTNKSVSVGKGAKITGSAVGAGAKLVRKQTAQMTMWSFIVMIIAGTLSIAVYEWGPRLWSNIVHTVK